MYAHLLVATDGSKLSDKAVAHAIGLAQATRGKLTLFYASPPPPPAVYAEGAILEPVSPREYTKGANEAAEKILSRAKKKVEAGGVACATMHTLADAPWEAILAAAKKGRCDAIVMASHGRRGLASLLLGSETTRVLTHSKLPVLVVR